MRFKLSNYKIKWKELLTLLTSNYTSEYNEKKNK